LSADLAFFTPTPFSGEALAFRLKEAFGGADVALLERDTLILFLAPEKLKFSLFYLPYELLSPTVSIKIGPAETCPLASFDDIEAMKAVALVQRGSAKDFIDLFFLLKRSRHSFLDLARLVQAKYRIGETYDYHLKTAMVYFDDAERELGAIQLADEAGGLRTISDEEWAGIKGFFARFCR
jgi:hypothetical protein